LTLLTINNLMYQNFRKNGWSALHIACLSDKPDDVKTLLDGNAETEAKSSTGQTPLHVACEKGFTDCVRLLLDKKADVNAKDDNGKTPLHYACQYGHPGCIKLMLERGADLTKDNQSSIDLAIESKSMECVKLLWEYSAKKSSQ